MRTLIVFFLLITLSISTALTVSAQEAHELEGRWDLVITKDGKDLPSWLEISHSGISTLVGRFVHASGSARPISEIKLNDGGFRFAIPPQWEPGTADLIFAGRLVGDKLEGVMVYTDGGVSQWVGTKAKSVSYSSSPKWGKPIELFNGKDLSGWHPSGEMNQWEVNDGILKSPKPGSNLISDQAFSNFKLHAEFRIQKDGNSGIYLRGRYEVQIADNKGMDPASILFGGIYGFLTPNVMAAKAPGEWQTYDITLNGNRVTIVANGQAIITDQIIPGITGGALDSEEGMPGSFFIQGDHGPVEFRKFTVTPMID